MISKGIGVSAPRGRTINPVEKMVSNNFAASWALCPSSFSCLPDLPFPCQSAPAHLCSPQCPEIQRHRASLGHRSQNTLREEVRAELWLWNDDAIGMHNHSKRVTFQLCSLHVCGSKPWAILGFPEPFWRGSWWFFNIKWASYVYP